MANSIDAQNKGRKPKAAPKPPKGIYARIGKIDGGRLTEARKARKITIYDVGEMLGVNYTHYYLFEQGKRPLRFEQAIAVLRYLEQPVPDSVLQSYEFGSPLTAPRTVIRPTNAVPVKRATQFGQQSESCVWDKYQHPATDIYRADKLSAALKATGKRFKTMQVELGINYLTLRDILKGGCYKLTLLARVVAYAGLSFSDIYEPSPPGHPEKRF